MEPEFEDKLRTSDSDTIFIGSGMLSTGLA